MGMGPVNPTDIPNFIAAATPQGLRRQMLFNNIRLGSFVKYFDISFSNGKWYAWYFVNLTDQETKSLIEKKV